MDDEGSHGGRVLPELSNVELVTRLRTEGCAGVLWLRTAERMIGYATGTLRGRLHDGSINTKLARLGCPVRLSHLEQEHLRTHLTDRDDLVQDAVFAGLLRLRDHGILGDQWDPAKGADLMTYFVNGCVLNLPSPLRRWRTRRAATLPVIAYEPADLEALAALDSPTTDPALVAHDRAALQLLLDELPPEIVGPARRVAHDGLTWADACRREGMSPRVVEGHLRRYRRGTSRSEENR